MPVIQPAIPDPSLRDVLKRAHDHFGEVPNLVNTLASNPDLCRTITDFLMQSLGPGRIDWAFKELVILKTLRTFKCYYGYGAHERIALELGVSVEKLGDLANSLWQTSPHFTDAERVVLELVTQIAKDANDVSDELWARLHEHWDHGQLLEITAVITTFIMIGRVGDSLGVVDPVLFTRPVVVAA